MAMRRNAAGPWAPRAASPSRSLSPSSRQQEGPPHRSPGSPGRRLCLCLAPTDGGEGRPRFLKSAPVGSGAAAAPRPAAAASRGRAAAVLRRLARIEGHIRRRQSRAAPQEDEDDDEDELWSSLSRSSTGPAGAVPAPTAGALLKEAPRTTSRGGGRRPLGRQEEEEEEDPGGVRCSPEAARPRQPHDSSVQPRPAGKNRQLNIPTKTPLSSPIKKSSPTGRSSPKRLLHNTPSPPSSNTPVLSGGTSPSVSSPVNGSLAKKTSPKIDERSLSEGSIIRSLDELFSGPASQQDSSSSGETLGSRGRKTEQQTRALLNDCFAGSLENSNSGQKEAVKAGQAKTIVSKMGSNWKEGLISLRGCALIFIEWLLEDMQPPRRRARTINFQVNVLSLADLAPEMANQKEGLIEEATVMETSGSMELEQNFFFADTQSDFKPPSATVEKAAALVEDPGETEISEQLSGSSVECPSGEQENLTSAQYSDDFDSLSEDIQRLSSSEDSQDGLDASLQAGLSDPSSPCQPLAGTKHSPAVRLITTKEAAVQTNSSLLMPRGLKTAAAAAIDWIAEGPAASSPVVSMETLEELTTYRPAMSALNDMLKQNLLLIQQFVEASRHLHLSFVALLEKEEFHYHTLEEAKLYIDQHKCPPLTREQALHQLEEQNQVAV